MVIVSSGWTQSYKWKIPGTRVGPDFRNQTLAIKSRKNARKSVFLLQKNINYTQKYFLYIPSSYARMWGETNFQLREYPRSGSKAMSVEEINFIYLF